jgi:hypothetical protein
MRRIAPGVYDENGVMHLVLPELLEAAGYEDNEANRDLLIAAARKMLDCPVEVVE